jgi:hypothetical protein
MSQTRPLPNRVTPAGDLVSTPARGCLFGNRGGRFHDPQTRQVTGRPWASQRWICCELAWKGRRKPVWGQGYTDLFFLDEVTALAAGHRPCFECRQVEARAFAAAWPPPAGNRPPRAAEMDATLHTQRLDGQTKRRHQASMADLPDGAMIEAPDGGAWAIRAGDILRWSVDGYTARQPRGSGPVILLTPPVIVAVLTRGYRPRWHPSAHQRLP